MSTVRGTGLSFTTPAAARAHADRMVSLAEEKASQLRKRGDERGAERVMDRANDQAGRIRAAADAMDNKTTRTPAQPTPAPARSTTTPGGPSGRAPRGSQGQGRPRLPRQLNLAAGWGSLGWRFASLTIGIAFLTILVARRNGPQTFSAIAGGAANGLALLLEPIDPLAGFSGAANPYTPASQAQLASPASQGGFAPSGGHPGGPSLQRHHAKHMTTPSKGVHK